MEPYPTIVFLVNLGNSLLEGDSPDNIIDPDNQTVINALKAARTSSLFTAIPFTYSSTAMSVSTSYLKYNMSNIKHGDLLALYGSEAIRTRDLYCEPVTGKGLPASYGGKATPDRAFLQVLSFGVYIGP